MSHNAGVYVDGVPRDLVDGANTVVDTSTPGQVKINAPPASGVALTTNPPVNVDADAAAVGVGTTAARDDHKHDIATAAPVATGNANVEGTSTSLARADHVHQAVTTTVPPVNVTRDTAVIGASTEASPADHKHDVATAAAVATSNANTEGTSTSLARADHVHKAVTTTVPPVDITRQTAVIGTSTEASPADHKHNIQTAAPVGLVVGGANVSGSSIAVSRSDHQHEILSAAPVAVGLANAEGTATTFSRSDHVHAGTVSATWSTANMRYFLLDNDSGSDTNTGFVDATAGATIAPAGLARKTVAGLMAILPRDGNGRRAKILIKNRSAGATYQEADTSLSFLDLSGVHGYAYLAVSGSTDLTNSATDRLLVGGISFLAGPGGGGEWTTTANTDDGQVEIASGSISAAEATSLIGQRIRFTGNVNAALTNKSGTIYSCGTGASAIVLFSSINGEFPLTGDTFFFEQVGVNFRSFRDVDEAQSFVSVAATPTTVEQTPPVVGIGVNEVSSSNFGKFYLGCVGKRRYVFCAAKGSTLPAFSFVGTKGRADTMEFYSKYVDETGADVFCGGNRFAGNVQIECDFLDVGAAGLMAPTMAATGTCTIDLAAATIDVSGSRCVWAQGAKVTIGNGRPVRGTGSSRLHRVRVKETTASLGAGIVLFCERARLMCDQLLFDDTGARPAIKLPNPHQAGSTRHIGGEIIVADTTMTGSSGVLLDLSEAGFTRAHVSNSGTGGVKCAAEGATGDAITVAVVDLANSNIVDTAGNEVFANATVRAALACAVVFNNAEVEIEQGLILAADGDTTDIPIVVEAVASDPVNANVIGVAAHEIPAESYGFAVVHGSPYVANALTPAVMQYLSESSAGQATATRPVPSASSSFVLPLGLAIDANHIEWHPGDPVENPIRLEPGADTDNLTWSGLDGDTDKGYRIHGILQLGAGGGSGFRLKINSDDGGVLANETNTGDTDVAVLETDNYGTFNASDRILFDLTLNVESIGGNRQVVGRFTICAVTTLGDRTFVVGMHGQAAGANVTALQLDSSSGTFFAPGTRVDLEKVPT